MSGAVKAIGAAVVGGFSALVLFLVVIVGGGVGGQTQANAAAVGGSLCATSGPLAGLDATQASNARTIIAKAESMGGDPGATIATMTAITESGLEDLGNSTVVGGGGVGQGVGADHDSIGLFQQRPSWGTIAQRLDPATSTGLFMTRLLGVTGWQSMEPWVAAQTVQASAFDGNPRPENNFSSIVGGNYEPNLPQAQTLVTAVDKDAAALDCGALTGGLPANTTPGSHGLPANYTIPAGTSAAATNAILFAIAQLDKPYVYDTAGPNSFDCSGLTMASWAAGGVMLAHYTGTQNTEGTPVASPAQAQPGDLVLVAGDDGTVAAPGHVGVYLGDGLVINASDPTDGIRVQTFTNFVQVGRGLAGIRHIA